MTKKDKLEFDNKKASIPLQNLVHQNISEMKNDLPKAKFVAIEILQTRKYKLMEFYKPISRVI